MEEVCRACMTNSVALVDIFTDERIPSLSDMLNECLDCEIQPNDELPKKLCLCCICEVQSAFGFKRKCERSHQVLSQQLMLKVVKLETIDKDIDPEGVTRDHLDKATGYQEDENCYQEDCQSSNISNIMDHPSQYLEIENREIKKELPETPKYFSRNCNSTENLTSSKETPINLQSDQEKWEPTEEDIDLGCVKIEKENERHHAAQGEYQPEASCPSITQSASQPKKGRFECPHCPKSFKQSSHLNPHIRTHTGEKPYNCPHCPKAFSQASNLRKHMCIHSGERPFKCPNCPKAFTRHTDLQYHVSTHPGKQIYKCPYCTRYFIESSELDEHMRYHNGERSYKCEECSKEFTYDWQLQRHIRTHTGEQPFKCPHCPKSCVDKGDLGRHIRSHTGERPHKCPHCPKAFTRAAYLKTHINSHLAENS